MRCPYCCKELEMLIDSPYVYFCNNHNCKAFEKPLPVYIWDDLIYGVKLKNILSSKKVRASINTNSKIVELFLANKEV